MSKSKPPSGRNTVNLSASAEALKQTHPLLRGLLVTGAGFCTGFEKGVGSQGSGAQEATFVFCVSGCGWWQSHGRLSLIRRGDLLVLPPGTSHSCGPQAANPWSTHWARATGQDLTAYLRELALGPQTPVLHVANSPQIIRLFTEVSSYLTQGASYYHLLQASKALEYLLCCLIRGRQDSAPETCDTAQNVAQAIIYMSDHIREPLRVSMLARQAGLSKAHFGEVFKRHTGCSPREYLHLLRIHEACRLLSGTNLSIKKVAAEVGYGDPLHFSKQFRAFEGVAPSDYRGAKRA